MDYRGREMNSGPTGKVKVKKEMDRGCGGKHGNLPNSDARTLGYVLVIFLPCEKRTTPLN